MTERKNPGITTEQQITAQLKTTYQQAQSTEDDSRGYEGRKLD